MRNTKVANDVTARDQVQGDAVERPAFPQALLDVVADRKLTQF